jgi:hypothetical protein
MHIQDHRVAVFVRRGGPSVSDTLIRLVVFFSFFLIATAFDQLPVAAQTDPRSPTDRSDPLKSLVDKFNDPQRGAALRARRNCPSGLSLGSTSRFRAHRRSAPMLAGSISMAMAPKMTCCRDLPSTHSTAVWAAPTWYASSPSSTRPMPGRRTLRAPPFRP